MRKGFIVFLGLTCEFFVGHAVAQLQAPLDHAPTQTYSVQTLKGMPPQSGVIPWTAFADVRPVKKGGKLLPAFGDKIRGLDGQEIKVQGFMMPLAPGEKHTHFVLTVAAPTCSFCMPAGPEGVIEVRSKKPMKAVYDPVTLTGRLKLLHDDPSGLMYQMFDAAVLQ